MDKFPTVFLSYCWANADEAERIYIDLKQIGIKVVKDDHDLNYKDDLKSFMQSIRDADFAILLISEPYLKSVNCMYEAGHILKEKEVQQKILPVIIDGTHIFKTGNRIAFVKHWQEVIKELENDLTGLNTINSLEIYADLKLITEISQLIDSFIKLITSMLLVKYSDLLKSNYKVLLTAMDFDDVTYLVELLAIAKVVNINQKELLLDKYLTKYPANSFYHVIKANNCSKGKKYEQAKFNFLEALRLKPDNYEALNNLGMLYQYRDKDYEKAKVCFEEAIKYYPEFTIARLNLGVLKSGHFDDKEGAKEQYENILSYEPSNAKAHNNLGNYYKFPFRDENNFKIAESHFLKAIELDPRYIEAYINYGNLLKTVGRIEDGNAYYKKALKYDTGHFKPVIDVLIKSVKG